MAFQIESAYGDARKLSQSVLQAKDQLAMLNAELARILHLNCADIGQLSSARMVLQHGTVEWKQAESFLRFYRLLFDCMNGDGVAMRHWLRSENRHLKATPHHLIVDEDRLQEVITSLGTIQKSQAPGKSDDT